MFRRRTLPLLSLVVPNLAVIVSSRMRVLPFTTVMLACAFRRGEIAFSRTAYPRSFRSIALPRGVPRVTTTARLSMSTFDPSSFYAQPQQPETKDFIMQQTMVRVKDPAVSLKVSEWQ